MDSEGVFEVRESGYDTLSLRDLPVCMDEIDHHGASQGKNDPARSVDHISRRSITDREMAECQKWDKHRSLTRYRLSFRVSISEHLVI